MLEIAVRLDLTTTQETSTFELPYPILINKVIITGSSSSPNGAMVLLRDNDQPIIPLSLTLNEFVINTNPNTVLFNASHDYGTSVIYEGQDVLIKDTLAIDAIGTAGIQIFVLIYAEKQEIPDVKDNLVRDLAEAVTQVADGENLITAGEVFFQKRIRGLKQVGQGGFNN